MLCLYDLDQFQGEILIGILETHPLVLLRGMVNGEESVLHLKPYQFLTAMSSRKPMPRCAPLRTISTWSSSQAALHRAARARDVDGGSVEEDKIVCSLGRDSGDRFIAVTGDRPVHMVDEGWDLAPPTQDSRAESPSLAGQVTNLGSARGKA